MRRALVVVGLACACSKGSQSQPEPQPAPAATSSEAGVAPADALAPVVEPLTLCDMASRFLERGIECAPSVAKDTRSWLANLESIVGGTTAKDALPVRERVASSCAMTILAFERRLSRNELTCEVVLTAEEHAQARAFVDGYYGRRTKPRPTGDATIDRQLAELAASRDGVCSCTDMDCVRAAEKVVNAAVKPIPPEMVDAMSDGEAISDEVSRCRERIEFGPALP